MLLGLHPNALFTSHVGKAGGRGLSPRLWSFINGQGMAPDGFGRMHFYGDDFQNMGQYAPAPAGTVTSNDVNGYGVYVDTATAAASVKQIVGAGGICRIAVPNQDNHEAWLTSGGNSGTFLVIDKAAQQLLLFEARFRVPEVADRGLFVGLGEEALAAANTLVDNTGEIADKDLIGFHSLAASPERLDFVYRKAGAAKVLKIQGLHTLVANAFVKVGFVYNPFRKPSERLSVYVDNVASGTFVSKTDTEAATFPDAQGLAFLAGLKTGEAAAKNLDLDWWAAAQAA